MNAVDEFLHNIKFSSQQQAQDYAPFVYGHVATYDPKTHRVRLILPSQRDEDGTPVLSSWMPLGGTGGSGWGVQIAPMGGATIQNPTAGELCGVCRMDRLSGYQFVASLIWNQVYAPPFTDLKGGELGLMSQSGSSIKLTNDKNMTIGAANDLTMAAEGTITINSTGNCTLNSQGNLTLAAMGSLAITATAATISAMGGVVQKLVTAAMVPFFNSHSHPANGDPPSQQMSDAQLTNVMEAE